ncbi:peptidyl-alpha-hydroxyglycine alpha-amidating lyase 1-like isoform X2 [Pectinophora gossypiella]|uniref:peptidyl-alpha-hydroxyglycine alpha-amidating lyase 1-like isoform X2 n=1 Tax=Pectinophora gossypiella TaxID=13191 RepID=UPI00214E41A1|nr:peptidyl-alpha-hydroxyglycine alpha-amidating lyase 1-like isoform X2 [Pectinophora gossypiella]
MQLCCSVFMFYIFEIFFVLTCILNSSCGRRFDYYPGYYGEQENKAKLALEKLEHAPQWVKNWPDASVKMGQVSGVALDNSGNVLVFHRGHNVWDANTFSDKDIYLNLAEPPISQPTILVFNETGDLIDMWGENLFHMPHGITVDSESNVWVTDVAMHQVFKFNPQDRENPVLVLGEKFVPRDDETHFCKPSAVAVMSNGDFFVADGYCNTRIIKYAADGSKLLQFGRRAGESPFVFQVPHALTLAEDRGLVCCADRERGRAACFRADNGTYVTAFRSWLIGPRLFSVAYAPIHGGRLYVVNGPSGSREIPVRGYVIDFNSGRLIQTFAPDGGLSNPHDVVVSPDGSRVYVAELNPYKVYKFVDDQLKNERKEVKNVTIPAKPTATIGK